MSAEVWVPVPPERAFAVSRTQGAVRLRWDPFICSQWLLDGAIAPGRGVRTHTRSRLGPRMVSQYVAYHPPVSVGMKMVEGPWFFARFGGGWRFVAEGDGTRTIWRYTLLANHVEKCRLCRPFATKFGGGARNAGQPEPSWRR